MKTQTSNKLQVPILHRNGKFLQRVCDLLESCPLALRNLLRLLTRAVRRRHCVGGGAPVNFGRRRRAPRPQKTAGGARGGGGGAKKIFFLKLHKKNILFSKIHEKISFYPQNFLRNFFSHQSFEVCR